MFKQLSPTSWIRASEIESLDKSGTATVIQMKSGRVFQSSYPIEYYLDGLGPVGIKDYEESLAQVKEHLGKVKWFDEKNRTYEWVDREEWNRRYFQLEDDWRIKND